MYMKNGIRGEARVATMSSESPPDAGSVSKVECVASVHERGEAKVDIFRHMAPMTVNAVLRAMPLNSRVSIQPAMTCLITSLRIGVEKPRNKFARGEVAFLASGGLICVFLREAGSERPLNPLGGVVQGLSLFEEMKPGDVVHLSVAPVQS
jgi:hypothetical protein